jgi:hypothetical protein
MLFGGKLDGARKFKSSPLQQLGRSPWRASLDCRQIAAAVHHNNPIFDAAPFADQRRARFEFAQRHNPKRSPRMCIAGYALE